MLGINTKRIKAKITYDKSLDAFNNFTLDHPLSICYQVTLKCNFRCPHCISSSDNKQPSGPHINTVKAILDEIKKSGIIRLDLTGGEPFIRKDINEILRYAVKYLGLNTVVTSNGSLINHSHAKTLSDLNILTQISLDGPEKINDTIRGKGSYKSAMKAIKILKEYNTNIRINCLLQRKNVNVLKKMIDICKQIKVNKLYFIIISAQGKASNLRNQICFNKEEENNIRKKISNLSEITDIDIKFLDYRIYSQSCNVIDPYGNLYSQSWGSEKQIFAGNILKQNLKQLWQNLHHFNHIVHLIQYLRY